MVPTGPTSVGAGGGLDPATLTTNWLPALHGLVPYALDALTYQPQVAAESAPAGVYEQVPVPEPHPALDAGTDTFTATP